MFMSHQEIKNPIECLEEPVITEKATKAEADHIYVFWIKPWANKITVKQAIKKMYNIWPLKVNILNTGGKSVRYGRSRGRTKMRKKAIIYLRPDQKIDLYK